MRKLIFATVALLLMATPAIAQEEKPGLSCTIGSVQQMAEGFAAMDAGTVKGAYMVGEQLASFRAETGLPSTVIAVFLFEHEGMEIFAFAMPHEGGAVAACFGPATPKAKALFVKHRFGQGA